MSKRYLQNLNNYKIYLIIFLLSGFTEMNSQDVKISGKVTNMKGKPIANAYISEQGTNNSSKANENGEFNIEVPAKRLPTSLIIRSVGLGSQQYEIDGKNLTMQIDAVLDQNIKNVNEIVISASKKSEKIINSPASVSILSESKIKKNTSLTVVDNIRKIASVDVIPTGLVSSNVNVRGFNNIFSGSLLSLIDNRVASVPSLRVNAFHLIPVSNTDLKNIEVVRGPASALYGPYASNGVLAMYTKSPLEMENRMEITTSLTTGLRSNSEDFVVNGNTYKADNSLEKLAILNPEMRIAMKISKTLGFKISGNYISATDYSFYDNREPNGQTVSFGNLAGGNSWASDGSAPKVFDRDFAIKKYSTDARLDWRPTDNVEIVFSGGYSNANNIELTGLGAARADNWINTNFQTRAKIGKLFLQYFINESNSGNTYIIPQTQTQKTFTYLKENSNLQSIQAQHSSFLLDKKLNLVYGADMFMTRPRGNVYGIFENKANINQYGLYNQAEYKFNKKISTVLALRADYQDVIDEWMFSPRGAIVFKPKENQTLRLTYNRAFSSPSALNFFLDLYSQQNPTNPKQGIRGMGNSNGYNYFDANGNLNYTNATGQLVNINSSYSAAQTATFGAVLNAITKLPARYGGYMLNGIQNNKTAITPVDMALFGSNYAIEIAKFNTATPSNSQIAYAMTNAINNSKVKASSISNTEPIKSTITQTAELGYKGFLMDKLSLGLDFYYTRMENYVSPLISASYAMMVDPEVLNANTLEAYNASGQGTFSQSQLDALFGGNAMSSLTGIYMAALKSPQQGILSPTNSLYPNDIILAYQNLGTVDVAGIDLSMNYQVNNNLNIEGAFSFVNKDKISMIGAAEGYIGLNAPKYKSAFSADYKLPLDDNSVSLKGSWRWMDAFPANSAIYIGEVNAVNLFDVGMSWVPSMSPNTIFSFTMNNLLDHRHNFFPGTPGIGRIMMLKMAHTFGVK